MKTAKKKMTAAETRVRIAKDVLLQLKSKWIRPTREQYLPDEIVCSEPPEKQLKGVLENLKSCEVCQCGAMFAVSVKRFNAITVGEASDCGLFHIVAMQKHLKKYFTALQLARIECAFMKTHHHYPRHWGVDEADVADAVLFGFRYVDDASRMTAIMQNVIDNNGTFKP